MSQQRMPDTQREPRVAVFCRCGARWFGKHAIDNPVIASHRARCGPPITGAAFERAGFRFNWPYGWTQAERDTIRAATSPLLDNMDDAPSPDGGA